MRDSLFPFETDVVTSNVEPYYKHFSFNTPTALVFTGWRSRFIQVARVLSQYDTNPHYVVKPLIRSRWWKVQAPPDSFGVDCYGVLVFPPGSYLINVVDPFGFDEFGPNPDFSYNMKFAAATGNEESTLDIHLAFGVRRLDTACMIGFDFEVPGRVSVVYLADETRAEQYIKEHRSAPFVTAVVGLDSSFGPSDTIETAPTESLANIPSIGIGGAGNVPILMGQSFSVDTPNRIAFFFNRSVFVPAVCRYQITWRGRFV